MDRFYNLNGALLHVKGEKDETPAIFCHKSLVLSRMVVLKSRVRIKKRSFIVHDQFKGLFRLIQSGNHKSFNISGDCYGNNKSVGKYNL